jgi:hypothetical protein
MPSETPQLDTSNPPFALDDAERGALDVIVVGGGVAGAYAAWRLQTGQVDPSRSNLPAAPQDRTIAVLEASGRIGGRLESLSPPGAPELLGEFGGMGFTAKNTILTALVDDVFHIAAEPFPRGGEHNLFYLRGVRLTKAEVVDPTKVPYNLTKEEGENIAHGPMGLLIWAIEKVLPNASTFDAAQWKDVQENFLYKGRHLRNLGFWNFLQMNMTGCRSRAPSRSQTKAAASSRTPQSRELSTTATARSACKRTGTPCRSRRSESFSRSPSEPCRSLPLRASRSVPAMCPSC